MDAFREKIENFSIFASIHQLHSLNQSQENVFMKKILAVPSIVIEMGRIRGYDPDSSKYPHLCIERYHLKMALKRTSMAKMEELENNEILVEAESQNYGVYF